MAERPRAHNIPVVNPHQSNEAVPVIIVGTDFPSPSPSPSPSA